MRRRRRGEGILGIAFRHFIRDDRHGDCHAPGLRDCVNRPSFISCLRERRPSCEETLFCVNEKLTDDEDRAEGVYEPGWGVFVAVVA